MRICAAIYNHSWGCQSNQENEHGKLSAAGVGPFEVDRGGSQFEVDRGGSQLDVAVTGSNVAKHPVSLTAQLSRKLGRAGALCTHCDDQQFHSNNRVCRTPLASPSRRVGAVAMIPLEILPQGCAACWACGRRSSSWRLSPSWRWRWAPTTCSSWRTRCTASPPATPPGGCILCSFHLLYALVSLPLTPIQCHPSETSTYTDVQAGQSRFQGMCRAMPPSPGSPWEGCGSWSTKP